MKKPSTPTHSPQASEREEAKQETREALLRAGLELFAEQGLDVPSLDALCARAGYTRGAFYVHFTSREDFTVAVMESATSQFVETLLSAPDHSVGLMEIVTGFGAALSGGGFPVFGEVPVHQFLTACARSPALRERYLAILLEVRRRLAEAVRRDQQANVIRADADPELTAGLLLAMVLGVGTMSELTVPFDPPAHAGAVVGLLAKPSSSSPKSPPPRARRR